MTHGSKSKRQHGSIGSSATPSRVLPGLKMAGQMGNERKTIKNLQVGCSVQPSACFCTPILSRVKRSSANMLNEGLQAAFGLHTLWTWLLKALIHCMRRC